jgi:hypothetical protein
MGRNFLSGGMTHSQNSALLTPQMLQSAAPAAANFNTADGRLCIFWI